MNTPLPLLPLALALWVSPGFATPDRAAQQAGEQPSAMGATAQPAPAALPAEGDFPPAMMQAMAQRDAAQEAAAQEAPPAEEDFPPAMMQAMAERDAVQAVTATAPVEPAPQLAEAPAGPPVTDRAVIDQRAQAIAEGLRCPVCQGLSAADSQAESAIAMRTRAGDLVATGYSDAQINSYFVERYGEWVLLEPPRTGRHWLIWLGPLVLLGLGALVVAWRMTAVTKPSDAQRVGEQDDEDAYERRILDELERS